MEGTAEAAALPSAARLAFGLSSVQVSHVCLHLPGLVVTSLAASSCGELEEEEEEAAQVKQDSGQQSALVGSQRLKLRKRTFPRQGE